MAALVLFGLGLLSKTVIATLPAALLVVFWWQRGKLSWKQDVRPLLPFFLAGVVMGLFTAWVERKFIGAEGKVFDLTLLERMLIAGRVVWFYLGKLFWPAGLVFIYPRWEVSGTVWWQYLFPAATLLLLAGLWAWRRRNRGPLAALLFFVGTLFPALGFLNVYPFRYSFVADHFQYLASLGVITVVSAGAAQLLGRWRLWEQPAGSLLCLALLATLAGLTWRQCGMYANLETLWTATLARNPDCFLAHNNFGNDFLQKGQVDDAIAHFRKAVEIRPDFALAHYNLGNALLQKGQVAEAVLHFQKSLEIHPGNVAAHNNLGSALLQQGQVAAAIACFQQALALQPDFAEARYNLGNALLRSGQTDDAIAQYQKVVEIQPGYVEARYNLGNVLLRSGRVDEAIVQYQKALDTQADLAEIHNNLGNALVLKGRVDDALAHFRKALEIQPDFVEAHNNLARTLLQKGQAQEAQTNSQKSLEIQPETDKGNQ